MLFKGKIQSSKIKLPVYLISWECFEGTGGHSEVTMMHL